jgi:hypothetical protein
VELGQYLQGFAPVKFEKRSWFMVEQAGKRWSKKKGEPIPAAFLLW